MASGSVMSAVTPIATPPSALMSATARSTYFVLRATTATWQPSLASIRATSKPIPLLPPTTNATLPAISRSIGTCLSDKKSNGRHTQANRSSRNRTGDARGEELHPQPVRELAHPPHPAIPNPLPEDTLLRDTQSCQRSRPYRSD